MRKFFNFFIISFITIALFLLGSYWLIKTERIHFHWTDQLMKRMAYEKAQDSDTKILILGDSQLEKWPFEHCLYKDMAEYFDERDIGYLNAAHFGFGPIEYNQQLKEISKVYKPDYVLLFYYAGNDLTDVSYRKNGEIRHRTYPVIFEEKDDVTWSEIQKKSIEKVDNFDWDLFEQKGIDPEIIQFAKNRIESPDKIGENLVNPHILALGAWKPDNHYDNLTFNSVESQKAWYHSLKNLSSILALTDSLDAKLGIVVIPSNVQVDTSHYDFYRRTNFNIDVDLLFSNTPQRILYEFCSATQTPYFNLLPHFKSFDTTADLYLTNDDHLSEKGHELSFEALKYQYFEAYLNETSEAVVQNAELYLKNYESFLVEYEMEKIRNDSVWFEDVKEKAKMEGRSLENQLRLDALYLLEHY